MSADHFTKIHSRTHGLARLARCWLANNLPLQLRLYSIYGRLSNRLPIIGKPLKRFAEWYCEYQHGSRVISREEVCDLIEASREIVVFPCSCRQTFGNCNRPSLNCLIISDTDLFVEAGKTQAKYISKQEGKRILEETEKAGLFHNISHCAGNIYAICNCCSCCCIAYRGRVDYGVENALSEGKMFAALVNRLCNGCGLCLRMCNFKALKMGDSQVEIDSRRCFGCGLCRSVCPQEAIVLINRSFEVRS